MYKIQKIEQNNIIILVEQLKLKYFKEIQISTNTIGDIVYYVSIEYQILF